MNIWQRLEAGVVTQSPEECQALAAELAPALPRDCTLALHGDMGVGKTTFVRGLARAYGYTGHLTSPTFTVFNLHATPSGVTLAHMDAYRLESPGAVEALMLEDFLLSPFCLVVEWPEKIAGWLPQDTIHLRLGILPDHTHTVRLEPARG